MGMEMKAAAVFKEGMILQRQKPVCIWGTGKAGKKITITITRAAEGRLPQENVTDQIMPVAESAGGSVPEMESTDSPMSGRESEENQDEKGTDILKSSAETVVSGDGSWAAWLEPMEAAVNLTMSIVSEEEQIVIRDVAVGEVWVAGGQSNIEFPMWYEKHYREVLESCENQDLRFYDVPMVSYEGNLEEFDYSDVGVWRKAGKEDLGYFSAVGYFFQRKLQEHLHAPVGIIGCNWGGTTTSVWADAKTVEKEGEPWLARLREKTKNLDMESWKKAQHGNPANAHGRPNQDLFSAFMLSENRTTEEMQEFLNRHMGEEGGPGQEAEILKPQELPGSLYEHMTKRLAPYAIRGVLWYQGESDDGADTAPVHGRMLKGLIGDWRGLWKEDIPFLVVQLPGFRDWVGLVGQEYPELRRQQEWAVKAAGNAWLCSASDAGEETDIHPKDKKIVGDRLSLLARGHIYGEKELLCDAPEAAGAVREMGQIKIFFRNAGKGLFIEGDEPKALEVRSDGNILEYRAELQGDTLILHCLDKLGENVEILFAQTGYYCVNLYNPAHIPAKPFRIGGI